MRKPIVLSALLALGTALTIGGREGRDPRPLVTKDPAGRQGQPEPRADLVRALREHGRKVPRFNETETRARFPGSAAHGASAPELLHALEQRDSLWAPEMESTLARTYFRADLFEKLGLRQMRMTEVSCRQTTCRLSYEYPSSLRDLVKAAGLAPSSPMVLVEEELGWASPRGGGLQRTTFAKEGEAYEAVSVVLGFDEDSWDPAGYPSWVQRQVSTTREFYRQARAAQRKSAASEALPDLKAGGFVDAG
jgi:hypothetical protein